MERIGVVLEPKDIGGDCVAATNPAVYLEEETGQINVFCRAINPYQCSEIRRVILDSNYQILAINPVPALAGNCEKEKLGCEDPRITKIGGKHYLTYTAVCPHPSGPHRSWCTRIGLAESTNLSDFHRLGLILNDRGNNKNGVLIGNRISGRYFLYHRFKPNVWITHSHDLKEWHGVRRVMSIRPDYWDCVRVGIGTVLETDEGWLAFYHGADKHNIYRLGVALFDLEHPDKLLARGDKPILEPQEPYEKEGLVPRVVFTCGAFSINGSYIIFYGAADRVTAACEITKKEVMKNLVSV